MCANHGKQDCKIYRTICSYLNPFQPAFGSISISCFQDVSSISLNAQWTSHAHSFHFTDHSLTWSQIFIITIPSERDEFLEHCSMISSISFNYELNFLFLVKVLFVWISPPLLCRSIQINGIFCREKKGWHDIRILNC